VAHVLGKSRRYAALRKMCRAMVTLGCDRYAAIA